MTPVNLIESTAEDPRLSALEESWPLVLKRYCQDVSNEDCPWWYRERPLVGLLSAAVWIAGGVTLEEYGALKGQNEKGQRKGRTDLFISLNGAQLICEAKHQPLVLEKIPIDWDPTLSLETDSGSNRTIMGTGETAVEIKFWTVVTRDVHGNPSDKLNELKVKLDEQLEGCEEILFQSVFFPDWAMNGRSAVDEDTRYLGVMVVLQRV